jgi:putative FmdB family regulatory protein
MPIYEYKCAKCGVVEVMQGIKEASLKKCPNCKSKVERMISSSSFVLKGSGWYATDYAKKSTPPPADTSSSSNGTNGTASASDGAKPTTEKSASASESKPAASSEKSSSAKPASTAKSD